MVVLESEVFVSTSGFQFPFDTKLQYRNLNGTPGWDMSGAVGGLQITGGQVNYKEGPNSIKIFYPVGGGAYQASYFVQDRLQYDSGTSTYELRRSDGLLLKFYASGKLKSFQNLGGVVGTITYSGGGDSGNLASVSMTDGSSTWAYAYTWTSGRLSIIIFTVNSTNVRKLEFAYDGSNRLKTIKSFAYASGSWSTNPIEATLYTYHGSTQLLRHVITPTGYRQMVNNGLTPDSMSGDDFNPYAETEYAYYSTGADTNRVQTMYTHGRTYTYGFTYTDQSQASTSLNVWTRKAAIAMPDGSTVRYYFNRGGQIMLHQVDSNGSPNKTWNVKYQQFQENTGRLLLDADATAIDSVDEGDPGLVTLESGAGRVRTYTYHSSGHLNEESVQEGASGTVHVKSARTYTFRSATGALGGLWVPASETVYSDTGLGGGATTSFSYSWHGTTLQMSQRVTTRPVVATGQNGTGTATTITENFNTAGYLTSMVDEEGVTTQYTFDAVTGGMTQKIVDPGSSPHLDLTTDYTLDSLGRTTLELGPAHDIDLSGTNTNIRRAQWTQYLDEAGETRSFAGYRKTTGSVDQIVGPVTILAPNVSRQIGSSGERQAERIDAIYTTAGIPSPTTSFARSTYVRWTIELYSQGNKLKEEWSYFVIPSSGYGTQSTNYGKRLFAYDTAGRLNQTTCAGGTIDKTTFNAMGWAEKEEIGTSAGLTTTETKEYFDTGTLKKRTLLVDGDTAHNRVWDYSYDYRQRLLEEQTTVEKDGTGTWTLLTRYEYDNRDLQTAVTNYHTAVTDGNRTGRATAAYDPLGRLYRQQRYAVSSSGVLGNTLTENLYYSKTGQVAREERAGSALAVATKYDAAGRPIERYWATGTFSTSDPASVTSATVVEQEATVWDKGSNPISTVRKQRFDAATGTGALNNKDTQPKARIYYKEAYHDGIGREQAVADYGTNGGSAVSRSATIPARSDTVLVTSTSYSNAGNVATITDPAGVATCQTWDAADRLITVTDNCWTASSSSSSSSSGFATDVRTTRFEYTDDGWLKKLKNENAATGQQVTEWVYGVTPTGSGSSEQGLYSNRLVREKIYPTPGAGSSTVQYAYNRQKQVRTFTDQISTAHAYSYDKLGRLIMDAVTAFGSGINDTIEKLVWGYDNRGRLARGASLAKTTGTILNEVLKEFNDFNQITKEYQEHGGATNTGTSLKVQYGWANGSSNTIRQTGLTYPNAGTLDIDYGSGLDSSLSRPLALKESSTTIASMRYLGLGVQVGLKYDAASSVHFTYEAGGTGDAADIYTGLDRFGRLVETIWIRSDKYQVRTQYGRNRVGGVVWKKDVKASTGQDHYYWYDRLQQVRQHQRGTLTPGSPPYTGITSLQQTEVLTFDETGNWLSYSATSPSSVTQYRTHNKANWITALTGSPDGIDPVYANTGNMTTMPKVGAWTTAQTLVWDAWNRLIEVNEGGSDVSTNTYDAFHRRIRKVTASETRDYYYDFNWRSVEERVGTPGSQTVKAQYTWSPTDRWTMIRRKRSTTGTLNEVLYVLQDYLDPAALLAPGSPNATVVERFGFDAFGPVRYMDGSFGSIGSSAYDWNFLFHAEFMDQESGLYNYGYRFYHPGLGRWLANDPLKERSGTNLSLFVMNRPNGMRDVLGLQNAKWPDIQLPDGGIHGVLFPNAEWTSSEICTQRVENWVLFAYSNGQCQYNIYVETNKYYRRIGYTLFYPDNVSVEVKRTLSMIPFKVPTVGPGGRRGVLDLDFFTRVIKVIETDVQPTRFPSKGPWTLVEQLNSTTIGFREPLPSLGNCAPTCEETLEVRIPPECPE